MSQPPPFGPQWQAYGPAPTPPPRKPRRWPWVVAGAVLLLVVVGVAGGQSTPSSPAGGTPTVWPSQAPVASSDTRDAVAGAAPGPLTSFGPGTFEVGTGAGEVAPGKYKTAGPGAGDLGSCYWARLKDTSGDFESIITNSNAQGPTTVTISKNDGAFDTRCAWTKAGA